MSSDDIAIRVANLSKRYEIYDTPRDRLKQFVLPRLIRLAGQPPRQYFREFWALKDTSFEIKKGETVGIIGRNGSGKSTLLQIICGTLTPTGGNVETSGRIAALLELGSGFNPEFTGRDNVYLNGAVLGLSKEEVDDRFGDIAAFAEIGEFLNQPVKSYSSGMLVRLAFAVQATASPDVLIVDEALAVGDEKFQRKCFARLEDLKSKGTSILFVSHSGPQIIELCDRAVLLERGECLMQSQPADVVRTYQRMIYAPADEQGHIIEKLRRGESLVGSQQPRSQEPNSETSTPLFDDFDPDLVPGSTTRYPEQGARIDGFDIRDKSGKKVNLLTSGEKYQFIVRGVFLEALERVYFGIHIRSITGTVITGQRFPEDGSTLEVVEPGRKFELSFEFNLALLSDTYFIGGGVWANEPLCAHRILDASMFRVMPNGAQRAFGFCDLSAGPARLIITQ